MCAQISIYNYLDYRQYLKAYYQRQKEIDPSFSYATWANKAGIKSRSFLRMVVTGMRPITDRMLPVIAFSLDLDAEEKRYFFILVKFNLATEVVEREKLFQELKGFKNRVTRVHDSYSYLSIHWCPKIHVLLTLDDLDRSAEAISKSLKLSVAQVTQVLEILQRLELAECDEEGQWVAQDAVFHIPDELNNLAIQSFHRQSLELAQNAIATNATERQYQAMFMPLSQEEYRELAEEIDQFTTRILNKYSNSKGKNRRPYQLNTGLIPFGEELIVKEEINNQRNEYGRNNTELVNMESVSGVLQ